jgi:hypothetical protein
VRRFVPNEVASAHRFERVFEPTYPGRGVKRGIKRASEQALAPNRGADRGDGNGRPNPRHRSRETTHNTAAGVLPDLFSDSHADVRSNEHSVLTERRSFPALQALAKCPGSAYRLQMDIPARVDRRTLKAVIQHYIRDLVYGATDGVITAFAIVAGLTGGTLTARGAHPGCGESARGRSVNGREQLSGDPFGRTCATANGKPVLNSRPARHGVATFGAFVVAGVVPILPYVFPRPAVAHSSSPAFSALSCCL